MSSKINIMGDLVRYPDILELPIFFQSITVMLSKIDERPVYDFFLLINVF